VRVALKGQARTARGSHERSDVSRMKMFKPLLERPTMTNRDPIPPAAVLVALDIAKLRNEVLIEMPGQQRRRRLSVLNNRTEHDRLIGCCFPRRTEPGFPSRSEPPLIMDFGSC
jgi:hypothetical protein